MKNLVLLLISIVAIGLHTTLHAQKRISNIIENVADYTSLIDINGHLASLQVRSDGMVFIKKYLNDSTWQKADSFSMSYDFFRLYTICVDSVLYITSNEKNYRYNLKNRTLSNLEIPIYHSGNTGILKFGGYPLLFLPKELFIIKNDLEIDYFQITKMYLLSEDYMVYGVGDSIFFMDVSLTPIFVDKSKKCTGFELGLDSTLFYGKEGEYYFKKLDSPAMPSTKLQTIHSEMNYSNSFQYNDSIFYIDRDPPYNVLYMHAASLLNPRETIPLPKTFTDLHFVRLYERELYLYSNGNLYSVHLDTRAIDTIPFLTRDYPNSPYRNDRFLQGEMFGVNFFSFDNKEVHFLPLTGSTNNGSFLYNTDTTYYIDVTHDKFDNIDYHVVRKDSLQVKTYSFMAESNTGIGNTQLLSLFGDYDVFKHLNVHYRLEEDKVTQIATGELESVMFYSYKAESFMVEKRGTEYRVYNITDGQRKILSIFNLNINLFSPTGNSKMVLFKNSNGGNLLLAFGNEENLTFIERTGRDIFTEDAYFFVQRADILRYKDYGVDTVGQLTTTGHSFFNFNDELYLHNNKLYVFRDSFEIVNESIVAFREFSNYEVSEDAFISHILAFNGSGPGTQILFDDGEVILFDYDYLNRDKDYIYMSDKNNRLVAYKYKDNQVEIYDYDLDDIIQAITYEDRLIVSGGKECDFIIYDTDKVQGNHALLTYHEGGFINKDIATTTYMDDLYILKDDAGIYKISPDGAVDLIEDRYVGNFVFRDGHMWYVGHEYKYGNQVYYMDLNNIGVKTYEVDELNTPLLYPNPTSDILHLDIDQGASFQIYDIQGRHILSGEGKQLDVSQLNAGMYMVSIMQGNQTFTQKFVKI